MGDTNEQTRPDREPQRDVRGATLRSIETRDDDNASSLDERCRRAESLRVQGRYESASQLYEEALKQAESDFGPESLEAATILNDLGVVYKYSGRFDDAQ